MNIDIYYERHFGVQFLYLIKEHFTKSISDVTFLTTTFIEGHELFVNCQLPQYFSISLKWLLTVLAKVSPRSQFHDFTSGHFLMFVNFNRNIWKVLATISLSNCESKSYKSCWTCRQLKKRVRRKRCLVLKILLCHLFCLPYLVVIVYKWFINQLGAQGLW